MAEQKYWRERLRLDGDIDGCEFGDSVAGSDTHIVAGDSCNYYAKVYDNAGTFLYRLDSPEVEPYYYGLCVAINSTYIYVGDAEYNDYGAVYIYDLSGALVNTIYGTAVRQIGQTIAVSETHLASGYEDTPEVVVFNIDGTTLLGTVPSDGNNYFGRMVALTDDHVFVHSTATVSGQYGAGSVVAYDLATFSLVRTILPSTPEAYAYFGEGMSAKNGVLIIGRSAPSTASIYSTDGTFVSDIPCPDCSNSGRFGSNVYVGDTYAMLVNMDDYKNEPAVYMHTLAGAHVWTIHMARQSGSDLSSTGEQFLSMTGTTALIGGDDIGEGAVLMLDQESYFDFSAAYDIDEQVIVSYDAVYDIGEQEVHDFDVVYGVDEIKEYIDFNITYSVKGRLAMIPFDVIYGLPTEKKAIVIKRVNS